MVEATFNCSKTRGNPAAGLFFASTTRKVAAKATPSTLSGAAREVVNGIPRIRVGGADRTISEAMGLTVIVDTTTSAAGGMQQGPPGPSKFASKQPSTESNVMDFKK